MRVRAFEGFLGLLPEQTNARPLKARKRRCLIAACGWEDRADGWLVRQDKARVLSKAYLFKYSPTKRKNRVDHLAAQVRRLGVAEPCWLRYAVREPQLLESSLFRDIDLTDVDEVVLDVSAMTKVLILLTLNAIRDFAGMVRLVYSEAERYGPSIKQFDPIRKLMARSARLPSVGADQVVRLRAFSSVRMQGQPITLVGFTSFNEQLLRHQLAVLAPHRLILINGRPPAAESSWREVATLEIHEGLRSEYSRDNRLLEDGALCRTASTLDYKAVLPVLEDIYVEFGDSERIICAVTGSKMQTVGLFVFREMHPDIQLEYPTPDSYFIKDFSEGVVRVHEVVFDSLAETLRLLNKYRMESSRGIAMAQS